MYHAETTVREPLYNLALTDFALRTLFVADEKTIRHVPHGCAFRVIMAEATSRQLDDTGDFGRQQNPKP